MLPIRLAASLAALCLLAAACESRSPADKRTTTSLAVEQKAPSPPAGPVPVPYPNVAAAPAPKSSAKVGGNEVKLKNKSSFAKSSGSE